jgi:hypothetical protein
VAKHVLIAILVFAAVTSFPAAACQNGSVRFAAFDYPRDVHKLCVIGNTGDPAAEAHHARLASWLREHAADLNVELVRVNADDPAVAWLALALPSAPPTLPVTVLAGWDSVRRRPFHVDHWEPAPTSQEMEVLARSSVRDAIKRDAAGHWAVLLFSRGTDAQSGAAATVLDAVVKKWAAEQPPGVTVVPLDRSDPKERLLQTFIGLPPSGPDWVGVLFGRGKLMAPPLEGDAITEENVNRLVELLFQPCTCLQSSMSPGVDIPLIWEPRLDATVVALGTDSDVAPAPAGRTAAARVQVQAEASVSPVGGRVPVIAIVVVVASALLVAFGAAIVWWRARASHGPPA